MASQSFKDAIEDLGKDLVDWHTRLDNSSEIPKVKAEIKAWLSKWNADVRDPLRTILSALRGTYQ